MPSRSQTRIDAPLQNLVLAAMQDDKSFVLRQVGAFVPVEHRTDKYFIYDKGAWNRIEMQLRGTSAESAGSGWTLSTATYDCLKYSVHKDIDKDDLKDTDSVLDLDRDASEWLENQVRLKGDSLFNATVMQPATWTVDLDGATEGATEGTSVLHWSNSSSDPQVDCMYLHGRLQGLCGRKANTMIVGHDVHIKLVTNPVVRAAIQYTEPTLIGVVNGKLADFFGVEQYIVGGAFYNSAKEGQTASLAQLIGAKDVFFGYVDRNPGIKTYSAFKTFAWNGNGGSEGVMARKFDLDAKNTLRSEVDLYIDVKVTAADAGCFIDGAVA